MKANIVLSSLWQESQWGQGRTFQMTAEHLSRQDGVSQVVCIFPPVRSSNKWSYPLRIRRINPKLTTITPIIQPFPNDAVPFRLWNYLNQRVPYAIRAYLCLKGFRRNNTIFWAFPPSKDLDSLLNMVPYRSCVGQIVDDFTADEGDHKAASRQLAAHQYDWIGKNASHVVVGSKAMDGYFSAYPTPITLMENGVDSIFIQPPTPLPSKLDDTRPRIGYIGYITPRTDIDLLETVATNRPEWDLIIAGPIHDIDVSKLSRLRRLGNVTYIEYVPYSEMPKLIATLDVCLIPHKDTKLSQAMSPLKLFQYAGSGRPIVSTRISGIERFQNHLYISENSDAFLENIENALEHHDINGAERLISATQSETWEERIAAMFSDIKRSVGWLY